MNTRQLEMDKILLIAGCSHAAGSEIDGSQDSEYNRQMCFGSQLALHLGYRPLNICVPGATNSSIARSVLKWFESSYDKNSQEVGVLIAWTDSTRIEVPSDHANVYELSCPNINWMDITARMFYRVTLGSDGPNAQQKKIFKYFHKHIADYENMLEIETLINILMLQYFLKSNSLKYLMCNSMPVINTKNPHAEYYQSLIDLNHYADMHNPNEAFYYKYKNLGYKNPKAKYWHHDEEPHDLYSTHLFNFVKEHKCL